MNCDYKIFNKIISNRLQPILEILIHDSQYARPGKDINELNCLVRDIIDEMQSRFDDSFFVSIDFRKAFDTICHEFLYQILAKYGFPVQFINLIKELFRDAGSYILINKFKSKKVKLLSGIQQGNTISRDLFILQINPLLVFLNSFSRIEKYRSLSNKEFLTLTYMDDANVVTQSLSSVLNVIFYTKKYEKASGLAINLSKSKGMFINKQNFIEINDLPNIEWSNTITCLKIDYGPLGYVRKQWKGRMDKFKDQVRFLNKTAFTLRAKSLLSKSKLFSLLSYIGMVHSAPANVKREINRLILRFLVPFLPSRYTTDEEVNSKLKTLGASSSRSMGGCEVDHISLHLDMLLLKTVMKYLKCHVNDEMLSANLFYVEYNVGLQLCNYFGIPFNNSTPHAAIPNAFYSNVLQIIHTFNITYKELTEGSINSIYKRIIYDSNRSMINFKSHRILSKVLPSYLQSFNYKAHFNLLPLKSMYREWQLDNDSCCYFCGVGYETIYHLLGTCEKLRGLWVILRETHFAISAIDFDYEYQRRNFRIDLTSISCGNQAFEKTFIYLNSIVNYSIWKHRNDIRYNFENFNLEVLTRKIIRSIGARKHVDAKLTLSYRVPFINQLFDALVNAVNSFPFDNG